MMSLCILGCNSDTAIMKRVSFNANPGGVAVDPKESDR
jgi:hypothetical protein